MSSKLEDKLQRECVLWFHKTLPEHRKCLIRRHNETTTGAQGKTLGLVSGASDLDYTHTDGRISFFELKIENSRHRVEHLRKQLEFSELMASRNCLAFFVFNLDQFKVIMYNINEYGCDYIGLKKEALKSRNFIKELIMCSERKMTKTVKIPTWK